MAGESHKPVAFSASLIFIPKNDPSYVRIALFILQQKKTRLNARVNEKIPAVEALPQIKIVLVEPTHPGNIGSVARAMKTMGLNRLVLVSPKKFPHYEASKLAAGAEDVLAQAEVVTSVGAAVGHSTLVLGTSVRDREVAWPTKDPKVTAKSVFDHFENSKSADVAILFGRESSGLSNEELDLCDAQIRIDANSEYSSLNLASAVQIIAYELRMRAVFIDRSRVNISTETQTGVQERQEAATKSQREGYMQHLQSTLESLDFIKAKPPTVLMRKLTRLYNKAELTIEEIQILRGILSAVDQKTDN